MFQHSRTIADSFVFGKLTIFLSKEIRSDSLKGNVVQGTFADVSSYL